MKSIFLILISLLLLNNVCDAFTETEDTIQRASNGSSYDQLKLGDLHFNSKNYTEAMKWYQKAAAQGEGHALFKLGEIYEKGLGVTQDYSAAFDLYRKAAQQNNPYATYKIGWFLQNGFGTEKNIKFAIGWYKRAADAGNVDALLALGLICLKGLDGETNYVAARIWYKRAADQGNAEAQNALGLIYQNGLGTQQDFKEAIKWYEIAAKNGNKDAQTNLDSINKNKLNSPAAFLKAATDGDPGAMYNLAVLYDNGLGTSVDHITAIEWFIKAAQKNPNSQEVHDLVLREKLYKENFKALENTAQNLRKNKIKFPGGFWKLERFYYVLSRPMDSNNEEHWRYLSEKIEKWEKAYPESVTARIVMGQFYTEYAWKARGTGYANTVSEKNWSLFNGGLKQAKEIMNEALLLPEKCPQWYAVMLRIAFGEGWEAKSFNDLFNKSIAFERSYLAYYDTKTNYLSPNWYGNEGDGVVFAQEMEQLVGGKEGLALYSHILWDACAYSGNAYKFMQKNLTAWDNIKQGFIYREELHGENFYDLNRFCYMAVFAGDKQTSRELFNRIGNNWDKDVFVTKNNFDFHKSSTFK